MSTDSRFVRAEAAGWERAGGSYDFFAAAKRLAHGPMLDAAAVTDATLVCDVASGPGDLSKLARERGARVVAADRSSSMLAVAAQRHPWLRQVRCSAIALPFRDGAFDVTCGAFLLNHVDDARQGLRELVRVSAGRVVVALWEVPARSRLNGLIAEAVAAVGGTGEHLSAARPFPNEATAQLALLDECGLTDVQRVEVAGRVAVPDVRAYTDGMAAATVRSALLWNAQPEPVRARALAELEDRCAPYRDGDRLLIPTAAVVLAGSVRT